MFDINLIHEARERINSRIHHTPVLTSRQFNEVAGKEVYFKCENFQRAGAFKIRGATNKIQSLTAAEKQQGIVAFSSGNHAQAVALAGREAGVRVLVAMPEDAPAAKVAGTRGYGAEVVFYDRHKQDREAFAMDLAERERLIMVPPYDDYLILAGQGTCGLELVEEVPELDTVLAPCSGGGLFAGVAMAAKALNSKIRCYPVEPVTADVAQQLQVPPDARGLIVTDVTPGGPAWDVLYDDPQRGGPDIILSVEGKAVRTEADLRKALQAEKGGSIVTVRVFNPRAQTRRVERIRLGDAK